MTIWEDVVGAAQSGVHNSKAGRLLISLRAIPKKKPSANLHIYSLSPIAHSSAIPNAYTSAIQNAQHYTVYTAVLLALLAETYSFINPSNHSAYYDTLWSRRNESYLYVILAAIGYTIRLIF